MSRWIHAPPPDSGTFQGLFRDFSSWVWNASGMYTRLVGIPYVCHISDVILYSHDRDCFDIYYLTHTHTTFRKDGYHFWGSQKIHFFKKKFRKMKKKGKNFEGSKLFSRRSFSVILWLKYTSEPRFFIFVILEIFRNFGKKNTVSWKNKKKIRKKFFFRKIWKYWKFLIKKKFFFFST